MELRVSCACPAQPPQRAKGPPAYQPSPTGFLHQKSAQPPRGPMAHPHTSLAQRARNSPVKALRAKSPKHFHAPIPLRNPPPRRIQHQGSGSNHSEGLAVPTPFISRGHLPNRGLRSPARRRRGRSRAARSLFVWAAWFLCMIFSTLPHGYSKIPSAVFTVCPCRLCC